MLKDVVKCNSFVFEMIDSIADLMCFIVSIKTVYHLKCVFQSGSYKTLQPLLLLTKLTPFFSHTFQQTLSKSSTVSLCICIALAFANFLSPVSVKALIKESSEEILVQGCVSSKQNRKLTGMQRENVIFFIYAKAQPQSTLQLQLINVFISSTSLTVVRKIIFSPP